MFLVVVIIIAVISVLLALFSLKRVGGGHPELTKAKKELKKGRVIFTSQDSSSSSNT